LLRCRLSHHPSPRPHTQIWFDGGLPSDSNFTARILALYNKYQPNAAAFNGYPQVRE